jgi:hypothetical protein
VLAARATILPFTFNVPVPETVVVPELLKVVMRVAPVPTFKVPLETVTEPDALFTDKPLAAPAVPPVTSKVPPETTKLPLPLSANVAQLLSPMKVLQ